MYLEMTILDNKKAEKAIDDIRQIVAKGGQEPRGRKPARGQKPGGGRR